MHVRKEEEREFHNSLRDSCLGQRWAPELEKVIRHDPLWSNMKYYSIERKSRRVVLDWYARNCEGKSVLDYCCGNGDDAFHIAGLGAAEVVGVDISEVSIRNCEARRRDWGVSNLSFMVMDGESLEFGDSSFDIVTEYGVLHHLNLDQAYFEIARVLKPDGKAICVEALGHNRIIQCYRRKTPHLRTEWETEHIMLRKDIERGNTYFDEVGILGLFHLATLGAVPFRNLTGFGVLLSFLEALDSLVLKLPLLKWQAWQAVFILSGPKK